MNEWSEELDRLGRRLGRRFPRSEPCLCDVGGISQVGVEYAFRLAKSEAGLMHYEGRDYTGLIRHLSIAMVVLGFAAVVTQRLRWGKIRN